MYLEYEIEAPSDQRLIHELEVLLERHFKTQKRLEFYSDHLDVSLRRLNAICIYHLHKTLYELIQERRFNESKKLLEHSTLSVKEITYYLGFCDPPYFITFRHSVPPPSLPRWEDWLVCYLHYAIGALRG
jgi:AraC-like DNA-binding protein